MGNQFNSSIQMAKLTILGMFLLVWFNCCTDGAAPDPTTKTNGTVNRQRPHGDETEPKGNPRLRMRGPGTGTTFDWTFCSESRPCGEGPGDCDYAGQCQNGLTCHNGLNNCRQFNPNAHVVADCCIPASIP